MARIAVVGYELCIPNELAGGLRRSNGRLPGSMARSVAFEAADTTADSSTTPFKVTTQKDVYYRFYLRIRKLPNAGGIRFWGLDNNIEGLDLGCYMVLGDDGKVRGYSHGNNATPKLVGTSTQTLALDTWYRISGHVTTRGPAGGAGANLFLCNIDGALGFTGSDAGTNTGLNHGTATLNSVIVGNNVPSHGQADGGQVEIDDVVCDNATEPPAGGVTLLHVTGQGTYNQWTAGFDWRGVVRRDPNGLVTAPASVQSVKSTAGANKTSYTIETMASRGLSGVTIKSTQVVAHGTLIRAGNQYIIRKNGADTLSATFGTTTQTFFPTSLGDGGTSTRGWFQDVATFAMVPSDTVEIGLLDGPTGTGTSAITGMYLLVEWEGADPTPTIETADIKILKGTYVGDGAAQEIAFADATFKPSVLIIIGDATGGALQRVWWTRGMGENGDHAQALTAQSPIDNGLARVYTGGFSVVGGANTLNTSGITYRYLAIRDHQQRFTNSAGRTIQSVSGSSDNHDVRLDNAALTPAAPLTAAAAFVIDAVIVSLAAINPVSDKNFYRDANHVGDSSSSLNSASAATADAIQSIGTGTFQLGNKLVGSSGSLNLWLAITDQLAIFTAQRLVEVGTYVGNGGGARDIVFDHLAGDNPGLVIVVPETATARFYRFYADGGGTTSRNLPTGAISTTAITAFDTVTKFSVNSALNTNLTKYHYLVFAIGSDVELTLTSVTPASGTIAGGTPVTLAGTGFRSGMTVLFDGVAATDVVIVSSIEATCTTPAGVGVADVVVETDFSGPYTLAGAFTYLGEQEFIDGTVQHPLTWIELTTRDENLHVFAEVDLNDPADYYGGYKAPWVIKFLAITRGLSDRLGQPEHMAFGAVLSDTTRFFRELLDNVATKYLVNRPLTERMIDDDARRLLGTPRLAAVGYVNAYSPRADLQFEINGSDWLKRKFSRKARAASAWQPVITIEDFPNRPDDVKDFSVPIIYGTLDDRVFETVYTNVSTALEFDPTIPAISSVGCADLGPGGGIDGGLSAVVTAIRAGKEGPISNPAGTLDYNRALVVAWNSVPGVDSYRVYMFNTWWGWSPSGGWPYDAASAPTFVRMLEHPNTFPNTDFDPLPWPPFREFATYFEAAAGAHHGVDALATTVTSETIDRGHGAVAPIYVGKQTVSGTIYHKFLLAAHACKEVFDVYVDGIAQKIATDAAQAGVGGIWLIPGYAGWIAIFGAVMYEEINGKRFFVVYGKEGVVGPDRGAGVASGPPTTPGLDQTPFAPLSFNLSGIEMIGDGTGTVVQQIALQAKHFAINYIAADTPVVGDWLTESPMFPHLPDLPLIDEISFDNVDVESGNRLPGGYRGDGIIGANGEKVSALDALALFNVSGDFDSFFNRKGQYAISMEPILQSAGLPTLNDVINITEGSFEIEDDVNAEFFNILPYRHTRDFTGRIPDGWGGIAEFRSDVSIDLYDQERASPFFDLHLLRDYTEQGAATVIDVMARKSGRYRDPRRTITLKLPFSGLNYEPGNIAPITHIEGIGADGWLDHDVRITRHEVEPSDGIVRLDAYDLESLFGLSGLWAPDDVPDNYDDATDEQKRLYLFWSDEGQNFYPDGAPVKNWS